MRMLALAAALALTVAAGASAQEYRVGDIVIDHPWAEPVIAGQAVAPAYLTIRNEGRTADRILAARTDVAERVEFHAMRSVEGAMRMTPLETVEVRPGEETSFAPGGAHVMLIAPRRSLASGDRFAMTLELETAGEATIEFVVQTRGDAASADHGSRHAP
jgi:copper(I)-binding protein